MIKYNVKKNSLGITLIALVITVIILLIISGIVLNIVLNQNLINKTDEVVLKTEKQEVYETLLLAIANIKLKYVSNPYIPLEKYYEDKNAFVLNGDVNEEIYNILEYKLEDKIVYIKVKKNNINEYEINIESNEINKTPKNIDEVEW